MSSQIWNLQILRTDCIWKKSNLQWQKVGQWLSGGGRRRDWPGRTMGHLLGDDNVLYFNCYGGYTGQCICKTHWNIHLKWVHFIVCKFYLNEVEFIKTTYQKWYLIILPFLLGSWGQPPWKGQHRIKEEAGMLTWAPFGSCLHRPPPNLTPVRQHVWCRPSASPTQTFSFPLSIRTLLVAGDRNPTQISLDKKKQSGGGGT